MLARPASGFEMDFMDAMDPMDGVPCYGATSIASIASKIESLGGSAAACAQPGNLATTRRSRGSSGTTPARTSTAKPCSVRRRRARGTRKVR